MNDRYNLNLKEGVDFQVKRGHWLPRKLGPECIAFRKTLYCKATDAEVPKHEFLHIVQFARYGTVRVLLHYVYHISKNLFRFRNFGKAFRQVPFEIEARDFEAGFSAKDGNDRRGRQSGVTTPDPHTP